MPTSLTESTLEAKIAAVEAAAGLESQTKTRLAELYRKALANLRAVGANIETAQKLRRAANAAPAQIQAIREALGDQTAPLPDATLDLDSSLTLPQIEQILEKEKTALAVAIAKQADLENRIEQETDRPALIRQRLSEAKEQQTDIAAQLTQPPPAGEGPATAEARRWAMESRQRALSAEIRALDEEFSTHPVRLDLLKAQRNEVAADVARLNGRVKLLDERATQQRRAEADGARTAAEEIRREAEGRHPLVASLAEQNARLTAEIADSASQLGELTAKTEAADAFARQLEEDFKSVKETIGIGVYGLNDELGRLLLEQRQSLPGLRAFRREARERDQRAGKVGAQRLLHRQELKRLGDPISFVTEIIDEAVAQDTPPVHAQLVELASERKALLEKAIETDDFSLRKLGELESAQQRLLASIERFDEFLDVHLLWVRSAPRTELKELGALPEQVWKILSPTDWLRSSQTLAYQATHSPVFALLAAALGLLVWSRKRLIQWVMNINAEIGKPETDRFAYTLQTLFVTLTVAAAWPLVAAVAGWQLKTSVEGTGFSSSLGSALIDLAAQFYFLRAFRLICVPNGLAAVHFRWPESSLRLLRRELDRLSWVFLPAAGVFIVAIRLDPLNAGWLIGRVAFVILVASLAFAFLRLLSPGSGVLAPYLSAAERQTFGRLYRFFYPPLVLAPLALGLLFVMGYLYTAGTLVKLAVESAWMVVGLIVLAGLTQRWLRVTRRRIAFESAMDRRRESLERSEDQGQRRPDERAGRFESDQPEKDLEALSDTSSELLNAAIIVAGVIGFFMIWSDVLPALRIFHEITLWHNTVIIDGEEKVQPITLADIGLAVFYGALTFVLAKRLPAILEIVLLHRFAMSAGSRYTFTTLTTYAVVTIGILLVLATIGAEWSQLQWLVAALGVGIGFGLQEIVANFISGIIILFERPIRIGDVVTVGDTDGIVTRIRIRATTVRNWDGKELLVPNKEFITGRLLNWSLSDQATRIVISVGIAYGSNVRLAMRLLEEAASENEKVLDNPAPSVIFETFGDNSLNIALRCFVASTDLRYPTISALNEAINDKFNDAGIIVPFPQRDLHLDTSRPLQVEIRRGADGLPKDGAVDTEDS